LPWFPGNPSQTLKSSHSIDATPETQPDVLNA